MNRLSSSGSKIFQNAKYFPLGIPFRHNLVNDVENHYKAMQRVYIISLACIQKMLPQSEKDVGG